MKQWMRHLFVVGAASLASGIVHAADVQAPSIPGQGVAPIYCVDGLERILPGDYYGCRAVYHLQRQHYCEAISMLKESAYWANKEAQHQLGLAYINGDIPEVPANVPLGIAWLALARERHQPEYEHDYALAIARSTPAQRALAATTYQQLRKRYADAVAGRRATQRFNREIAGIDEAANGGTAWISGFGPLPVRAYTISRQLHAEAESAFGGLQGSVVVGPLQRVQDRLDTAALPARGSKAPSAPLTPSGNH
ncbi:MAG: hypothetical protein ABT19_14350 [Rhodanobacter sp. SCN 68-63]|nr:MAG: hypothetical protein ABT19_14350 [Rhodanobacter sp. SCN 68-63]